ncbi:MAG: 16S rRNA (cytosine(1402)-N(4))-methyltransferase RsmH [Tannerella sp.]|jgi:16S rRNA (cytosine1402-N4)-methyltransferase|nr:16S rRNA (cytosine(1402)-N(4))-methyltransferase RsmH [Tannerella sp.]
MSDKYVEYHVPALLGATIDGLDIKPSGIYVDSTFGGGGHSRGILERLGAGGRLYGFDQDADAERNIVDDGRFVFVRSNFRYLSNFMRYYGVGAVDGILADLGVSSHHFDDEERGFSFRFDGELDMRMNNRGGLMAADVLNTYDEERLADVLYRYGELANSRRIAAAIVRRREATATFEKIPDLTDVLKPFVGRDNERKFFAKVFQALRIEVNQEMSALDDLLRQSAALLKPGGRLVVISYHSLEDRMVKNYLRTGNGDGRVEQDLYGNMRSPFRVIGKMITPSEDEIARNPRARSARLRIGEKVQL